MNSPGGAPNKTEAEVRHLVTQETRFDIIQSILAHPESLPSLRELEYVVDKGRSTIHGHLETLEEAGVVDRYKLENANVDDPSTFFGLTPYGLSVIDRLDVFDDLGLMREIYAAMDKPPEVQDYEDAPRPDKVSLDDAQDDLATRLEETSPDDESIDPAMQREIAGISYALETAGTVSANSAAAELGHRLLEMLDEPPIEKGVLMGLQEIASAEPIALRPAVPRLIERLNDTDGECQSRVLQVLATIAEADQTSFATDVREQLANLEVSTVISDLSPEEAQDVVFGLEGLYSEIDATEPRAQALASLGSYAADAESYAIAIDAFESAAALFEQLEDPLNRAETLEFLGINRQMVNADAPAEPLETAGKLYAENNAFNAAAKAYSHAAVFHAFASNIESASAALSELEPFEDEVDEDAARFVRLAATGLVAANDGRIETAVEVLREAKEINGADNRGLLGSVQLIVAQEASNTGYPELTHETATSAVSSLDKSENTELLATAHQLRARSALQLKDYQTAKNQYEQAIELLSIIGDSELIAACLSEMAYLHVVVNDLDAAEENLQRSLELLEDSSDHIRLESQLTLADIYSTKGDVESLEQTIESIENLFSETDLDMAEFGGKLAALRGELSLAKDNIDDAVDRFKDAIAQHGENEEYEIEASQSIRLATALEENNQYDLSEEYLNRAIELSEDTDWSTFVIASLQKVSLLRSRESFDVALETIQQVLDVESAIPDDSIIIAQARMQKGQILREMGRFDAARSPLTSALSSFRDADAHHLVLDVLQELVEISKDTDQREQTISWCQSAESYISGVDERFDIERELYFLHTRAEVQPPATGTPDLLYAGLQYLQLDHVEEALKPLRLAWQARDELDPGSEAHSAALSAGVGFAGATRLVSMDEVQEVGEKVLADLEPSLDALSSPATHLYRYLTESTDTYHDLELEVAERLEGDHTRVEQLEALAFRDLVEKLRTDDDDFQTDPTRPLDSALEAGKIGETTAVARQQAVSTFGRTAD